MRGVFHRARTFTAEVGYPFIWKKRFGFRWWKNFNQASLEIQSYRGILREQSPFPDIVSHHMRRLVAGLPHYSRFANSIARRLGGMSRMKTVSVVG